MCLVETVYGGCGHKIGGEIEPCSKAVYPNPCDNATTGEKRLEIMCSGCRRYYGCDVKPKPKSAEAHSEPKEGESKESKLCYYA
ncbi:predicted protein [Histoplasma mississippiense (nom. inval.)]|uniref:predicted protein n=1 Tax=Ajellomyces capsulatus (strain NAm1 / WU24) TaxID=2059318 RepID=UPI000157D1BD|nr:predicted protein [Histoplasma mississippiense (nom. inval.)]EDN04343.1 predicted protein [Histoplasma mississippiense (nom. inval.)]